MYQEVTKTLSISDKMHLAITLEKAAAFSPTDFADKFGMYQDTAATQAGGYADRLASGEIGTGQFRDFMNRLLRRAYADAYRYGLGAAGFRAILNAADLEEIRNLLGEEIDYLNNFVAQFRSGYVPVTAEDRVSGGGQFLLRDRAKLYTNALREVYYTGYTSRVDDTAVIDWTIGSKEPCGPCLGMADGSPYTRATLAGRMPGAGICDGLSRCKCELHVRTAQHA